MNKKTILIEWNGITLGTGAGTETALYAFKNEVSNSADVGITIFASEQTISFFFSLNIPLNTF